MTAVEATLLFGSVEWEPVHASDPDPSSPLPYVTMQGVLAFAGYQFRCYQLSDGRRVLDADDMAKVFASGL